MATEAQIIEHLRKLSAFENCTPCDPPTASHDTPAGKETAQAAVWWHLSGNEAAKGGDK